MGKKQDYPLRQAHTTVLTALFLSYSLLAHFEESRLAFLTLVIQHNIMTASWFGLQHLLHLSFWEGSDRH